MHIFSIECIYIYYVFSDFIIFWFQIFFLLNNKKFINFKDTAGNFKLLHCALETHFCFNKIEMFF